MHALFAKIFIFETNDRIFSCTKHVYTKKKTIEENVQDKLFGKMEMFWQSSKIFIFKTDGRILTKFIPIESVNSVVYGFWKMRQELCEGGFQNSPKPTLGQPVVIKQYTETNNKRVSSENFGNWFSNIFYLPNYVSKSSTNDHKKKLKTACKMSVMHLTIFNN